MIEVSDEDVEAVEKITGWQWPDFGQVRMSVAKEIIAAAWEVMRKKQEKSQSCPICNGTGACDSGGFTPWGTPIDVPCECTATNDLAEAVMEALIDKPVALIEFSKSAAGNAIVHVKATQGLAVRHVSLDDNFPALAAAAVRDLSRQVKN